MESIKAQALADWCYDGEVISGRSNVRFPISSGLSGHWNFVAISLSLHRNDECEVKLLWNRRLPTSGWFTQTATIGETRLSTT